ncbi:MAG: hypothetical protein H6Q33_3377 [Deltaproteobacteria bacterium]|nr:hypothetical protein [Deltaproteobacteria bacterium]
MPIESNPIATADQHAVELRALELGQHPTVRRAYDEVRAFWLQAAAPSPEMRACFEWAFDEVMFCAAVWSLNQDPQHPKVVTITRLAHTVGDVAVPGSRYGHDNPDSIYRVIPIAGSERYLINGQVPERRLTENYFTLWDPKMNTVDILNGSNLALNSDRTFTITVDSDPADGRPNHIRSSPQAHEFYIRDVILDWAADVANSLSIEKLGPPTTPQKSDDEQAELTARFMRYYAENTLRWVGFTCRRPVNDFRMKLDADTDGALRNQIYMGGQFRLTDEEALVLTVRLGGAKYFIAPITNIWGTTNDILNRTGSLNKAQSVANPDGTYTYVVSVADPGVHNWVDPSGLHEGIMTLRWAEFSTGRPTTDLGVQSEVVPLAQLRNALPAGTRFVTAAERREQIAERARNYAWRLLDH